LLITLSCATNTRSLSLKPDVEAEFPGGVAEMYKFFGQHMRYPEAAVKANVSLGRLWVSFTVNANGSLEEIEVVKDPGFGVVEEVAKAIKSMPPWKPAIRYGRAFKSKYSFPVNICPE
jgi:protein TonB